MYDLRILGGQVYRNGTFQQTNLYINGEIIVEISKELFDALETINVPGSLVLPALIDPHVHFHLDLGKIYSRDDFYLDLFKQLMAALQQLLISWIQLIILRT